METSVTHPDSQLHPSQSETSSYVERIRSHNLRNNRRLLYTGHDCRHLVKFLSAGQRVKSSSSRSTSRDRADEFAWVYYFKLSLPAAPRNIPSPEALQAQDADWLNYTSCGHLLLFRGYPSSQWLDNLGSLYGIDAEFWREHLSFLGTSLSDGFSYPALPSSSCDVLKLRIPTIGLRNKSGSGSERNRISRLRQDDREAMKRYQQGLRLGTAWRTGDSMVRDYTIYDAETFSIDQAITICLDRLDTNQQYWRVIIYTDCGKSLAASPHGPWLGDSQSRTVDEQTTFLPLHRHVEKIIPETANGHGIHWSDRNSPPEHGFTQNIEQLHLDLGRFLDHGTMSIDPFYAVTDVFKSVSLAELKYLNMISSKLDKDSRNLITVSTDLSKEADEENVFAQANLLQSRQVLEDHMISLRETLSFIQRHRGHGIWPSLESTPEQQTIARRSLFDLEHDFRHLLETADSLYKRCESAIVIAMNSASIAEARRGQLQARSLYKFQILASLYLPLSFTSAFMGMNVSQINSGSSYGIWLFFAITLPTMVASTLFLFVNWQRLYNTLTRLARSSSAR